MNVLKVFLGVAAVAVLLIGIAPAQQGLPVGDYYASYLQDAEPGAEPAAPDAEAPVVAPDAEAPVPAPDAEAPLAEPDADPLVPAPEEEPLADVALDEAALDCDPCAPWTMPQPCMLQNMGIMVGGWIQHGISVNGNSPNDGFNSAVALNDFDGEYQMNQCWLWLHKPVDIESCSWQIGGHIDMMYGTDWRYGRFFGLEERINGDNQFYGLVIPQAYLEIGGRNLSIKLGHMAGPLGYEVVPSVRNFFYSHSLAMNFTEPQLVTGLYADWKLNDQWSVQAGFHRGFFMFEDLDNNLDFMGGVKWQSCDGRTSIAWGISTGNNEGLTLGPPIGTGGPSIGQELTATSFVLQHQFTDQFKYVLQSNIGQFNNFFVQRQDAEWYGLNQYFLYTINDCWSAGLRFEWLRDDDGVAVKGIGNLVAPNRGWTGGGYAGHFFALTAGLNWRPHPNITFRPELRWDWYDGENGLLSGGPPFGDDDRTDQFVAAIDMLITF